MENLEIDKECLEQNQPDNGQDPFITSPYTTQAVTLCIGPSGAKYTVLQAIVDHNSGLKKLLNDSHDTKQIELREVDEDIGHTLVHYLYTERYQTLGLGPIPDDVRAVKEFKRSVLAYCAARLCGIGKLEGLTKEKIETLSKELSIFEIQRVIEDVQSKLPQDDDWVFNQMHRWIKAELIADDAILTEERILNIIGGSAVFDKAVVKAIAEMYTEMARATHPVVNGNHAREYKELTMNYTGTASMIEAAAHAGSSQQESDAILTVESTSHGRAEDKPSEYDMHSLQTNNVQSHSAQNNPDSATQYSEETYTAGTSTELSTDMYSEEYLKSPVKEPLETPVEESNRSNQNQNQNHEARSPVENHVKAIESEGESPKTKIAVRKGKKGKKKINF